MHEEKHEKKKEEGENNKKDTKYSILIIDDDKFLLDMYATKFSQSGFTVTTAFGGMDAITKIEDGLAPDIIMTDVVMPVMDGFEFLAELRGKKLAESSCVVVISNLGQKEDIEKGTALGADGYIIKATATPSEVVEKILEIVEKKNG